MIKATYSHHPYTSFSMVVSDELPKVGETIDLEHWGEVKVVSLYHNVIGNFIELNYKGNIINCGFEVKV